MKTIYYKVKIGYGVEDIISITKDELEKATYAFITKADAVFQNGMCRGKDIMGILPDYHKTMGWNYGHKMEDLDFAEEKEKIGDPTKYISLAKDNVQAYIASNQEHLIGSKPLEIAPKVEMPEIEAMKSLIEGMKA